MASRRRQGLRKEAPAPSQTSQKNQKRQEKTEQHESESHGGTPHHLIALQQQLGNAAVQRLLSQKRADTIKGQTAAGTQSRVSTADPAQQSRFLAQYPFAAKLVAQIDPHAEPKLIVEQLFNAFNLQEFEFTHERVSPESLLQGDLRGDSQTLTKAFALIMREYFGNTDIKIGEELEPFFAPAARIIGKQSFLGNVDQAKGWVFEEHRWIEFAGVKYDLLFHQKELKQDFWLKLNWQSQDNIPTGGFFQGKDDPNVRVYVDDESSVKEHFTLDPRNITENWADLMKKAKG